MKVNGAIFDLDGTLLDSMPIWESLGSDYLILHGRTPQDNLRSKIRLMTLRQTAEHFKDVYGLPFSVLEIETGINAMIEDFYFNKVCLKAGAYELLRLFQNRRIKMCIATATDAYLVKAALSRLGVLDYFNGVITCGELNLSKATPEIFEYALTILGTDKAQTPVFEDAIHAVTAAKSAGFPTVAIFDESFADSEDVLRKTADLYLRSLTEMEAYLD